MLAAMDCFHPLGLVVSLGLPLAFSNAMLSNRQRGRCG